MTNFFLFFQVSGCGFSCLRASVHDFPVEYSSTSSTFSLFGSQWRHHLSEKSLLTSSSNKWLCSPPATPPLTLTCLASLFPLRCSGNYEGRTQLVQIPVAFPLGSQDISFLNECIHFSLVLEIGAKTEVAC